MNKKLTARMFFFASLSMAFEFNSSAMKRAREGEIFDFPPAKKLCLNNEMSECTRYYFLLGEVKNIWAECERQDLIASRLMQNKESALLMAAILQGSDEVVSILLEQEPALVEEYLKPTLSGLSALDIAAEFGNAAIGRMLLASPYADHFIKSHPDGTTALHIAAREGNVEFGKMLLDSPLAHHFMALDNQGRNALKTAAQFGQSNFGQMLLESRYADDFKKPDKIGLNALHWAAEFGQVAFAKMLLALPFSQVFIKGDIGGQSALHRAAMFGHIAFAQMLFSSIDTITFLELDKNGNTPLHYAAHFNQVNFGIFLLNSNGAHRFLKKNKSGESALHKAAQLGRVEFAQMLLESSYAEAFIEPADKKHSALHTAAAHGHVKLAKMLLKSPFAKVFLEPREGGWSALHFATQYGHLQLVKMLFISPYVEHFIKPAGAATCLHAAILCKKDEIRDLILKFRPELAYQNTNIPMVSPVLNNLVAENAFILAIGAFDLQKLEQALASPIIWNEHKKSFLKDMLNYKILRNKRVEGFAIIKRLKEFFPKGHEVIDILNDYLSGFSLQSICIQRLRDSFLKSGDELANEDFESLKNDPCYYWTHNINLGTRMHSESVEEFLEILKMGSK